MMKSFRNALILAITASSFALTAAAQKPAIVRSDAEPGRNPYQQTIVFNQDASNCPSTNYCLLTFNPVPAGFRLVVTQVSASFALQTGATGAFGILSGGTTTAAGQVLLLATPVGIPISQDYFITTPTTLYVEPGASPTLLLSGSAITHVNGSQATVIGYLVPIS